MVVFNIAKAINWICLFAYLFIIAFWIYQFLKKEQILRLIKQLNVILINKNLQNINLKLSKNINVVTSYDWFEFVIVLIAVISGFVFKFKNGYDIGIIINDFIFLILGIFDFIFKFKLEFLFKDVQNQLRRINVFAEIKRK